MIDCEKNVLSEQAASGSDQREARGAPPLASAPHFFFSRYLPYGQQRFMQATPSVWM